jgi:hypothetical protein
MHKKKPIKMQPLFRREKDVAKLLTQKDGLEKLKEFANITAKMQNNVNTAAKDLTDWQLKACAILPEKYKNNQNLLNDITEIVVKYEINSEQSGVNS